MATPADGPSFGTAPAGTCRWMSDLLEVDGRCRAPRRACAPRTAPPRADSFMTSPSWPVRMRLALARHLRGLDEEDVAAGRRPGEAGRHARDLGALRRPRSRTSAARGCPSSSLRRQLRLVRLVLGDLHRDGADDVGDLALEVAHAGLARVLLDDRVERVVGRSVICSSVEPVLGDLLRAPGGAWRSRASPRGCSPGARGPPCGRAAPAGSVSSMLAVAMKMTFDRSKGTSR